MRKRADLGFTPQWDGPIKTWARGFIKNNKWRCDRIYEVEDLMQDAYLVFCKVVDYYPSVREPANFMALYKTSLQNEFHNYARQMRDQHRVVIDTEADIPEYTNWGYVAAALTHAPKELKQALAIYADDEKRAELVQEPKKVRFSRKGLIVKENLNAKLARLAGINPSYDVVAEIRRLFT